MRNLPSEYQEVEYIQSSGTQYIDTGYVLTSNPGCDIDFSFLGGDTNSWIPIFGSRNNSNGTSGYFCLYVNSNSLYVTPNYAGFDPGTSSGVVISSNTKYNIFNDKGQFYLNGVLKTSASTTNTYNSVVSRTFLLFACNNYDGTVQIRNCQMKLYGCKLYNNNVLVRDFVPCYRKSDGVIGLYDLVNNQFYTNSGTGTFSKGADVTAVSLKNAYIGEVYEYSYDFRNKSSTILTNDGWTVTGSPTFNSNGMSGIGPSVSRSLPTRNTANKITLTHTFDVRSGGSSLFRIGTMSNGSLTNVSGSYTLQGSYRRITIANSATNYNGVNNGTYTLVMTLDLVNDIWEVTTTGLSTQTGTITSTQKATILANMNNILADTYSSNGGYLQSLSVKIEK